MTTHRTRPLVLALWAASLLAVCSASLSPATSQEQLFPHVDKLCHFGAYAWLALLPMFGFLERGKAISGAWGMVPLGILLEVGQNFVPGREPSFWDFVANTAGVSLGIWLATRVKEREAWARRKEALGYKKPPT